MSAILEGSTTPSSYHALRYETPLRMITTESDNWLNDYKKTPGSIFKYYSVKNEFDFLKSAEELTPESQEFYIRENVIRYLGEFVGKIPYTTIHYEMDEKGFTFAGMHMMDSYQKAAEMTKRRREYSEVVGFQLIEDALSNKNAESTPPTSAEWISPPKDWDYGFGFIFEKGKDGKIVEHILRYPEKRGELVKSNELLQIVSPHTPPLHHEDDFLLAPVFGSEKHLDTILRTIGIDQQKIAQSHYFEEQVEKVLGSWISEYAKRIIHISKKGRMDTNYEWNIEQAEILLLSIYQQAQEIMNLYPYTSKSAVIIHALDNPNLFSPELLGVHALQLKKQKNLPQTEGGSCPVVNDTQSLLDPVSQFVSSHDIVNALKSGKKLEDIMNGNSKEEKILHCVCPLCSAEVDAKIANGRITCAPKEKGGCGESVVYKC